MDTGSFQQAVATLQDLGLTNTQAKVYLALINSGSSTIETIANLSKVARTDLYRITHELEKKGFVERVLDNPTQFKPIALGECIHTLLQHKNEENRDLHIRSLKMLANFKKQNDDDLQERIKSRFIYVASKRVPEKILSSLGSSEKSIDSLLSWYRWTRGMHAFLDKMEEACSRGAKFRLLIEKPAEKAMPPGFMDSCFMKNRLCETRLIPNPPQVVLGIYDKKEVFIIENPLAELSESPALWSNNHSLLSLANDYFDMQWMKATKINTQQQV